MRMILFSSRLVLGLLFVISLFSCETIILRHKKKKKKKLRTEVVCNDGIVLRKKIYSSKDIQVLSIFKAIDVIDNQELLNKYPGLVTRRLEEKNIFSTNLNIPPADISEIRKIIKQIINFMI